MALARFAYFRVLQVSSKSFSDELMQVMTTVKLFPPKESCSILVSLESLMFRLHRLTLLSILVGLTVTRLDLPVRNVDFLLLCGF